ncbi:MAG: Na(+)-translocating NADH-quinone reductase subunit A [Bacteroidales bacterium]|nr:Na(+)-translocating NADH-quinone reductase subunit A [Bacteroidales bacterium]
MSNNIKLKKGLDLPISGAAALRCERTVIGDVVAVNPCQFRGLVPRLLVKEGDHVLCGSPVLSDKKCPQILFTSPVSGTVASVVRGEKRKLLEVLIRPDGKRECVDFGKKQVENLSAQEVRDALLESGLWPSFVQRPFGLLAGVDVTPDAIFVSAFHTAPLAADVDFTCKDSLKDIQTGINAVSKLAAKGVVVSYRKGGNSPLEKLENVQKFYFEGKHPAGNVGVQIHHLRPIGKGDIVWTISPMLLAAIGRLFNTGKLDLMRKVAVCGPAAMEPAYVNTLPGVKMSELQSFIGACPENVRIISGDVLSGTSVGFTGTLGLQDDQITILNEGNEYELFGWAKPIRCSQYSTSRTYFSWLTPWKKYDMDTNLHGGERAFVVSDVYGKVLPMDLFPVFLAKACLAGNIEDMEKYGIYEVLEEDLAVCEYVCPSKINIQAIITQGIDLMIKETL